MKSSPPQFRKVIVLLFVNDITSAPSTASCENNTMVMEEFANSVIFLCIFYILQYEKQIAVLLKLKCVWLTVCSRLLRLCQMFVMLEDHLLKFLNRVKLPVLLILTISQSAIQSRKVVLNKIVQVFRNNVNTWYYQDCLYSWHTQPWLKPQKYQSHHTCNRNA